MYKASYKEMISLCIIFLLSSFVLGHFLRVYTDASFPELDSTLTCGSLIAQYLQTKKKIPNWIIWILVDIVYVFLFINKGLYSTAALYALYCIMAIRGYKQWKEH
jgi:nicotinamide mononucleotide transporter